MTKRFVVGNWKMYKTVSEAEALVRQFIERSPKTDSVDVAFAPPFLALQSIGTLLTNSPFHLAGQNLFWEKEGAYTGEVSGTMLRDIGCTHVIIGHSERRRLFGERNEDINKKIRAALDQDLQPILCVGETLEERQAHHTHPVIEHQTLEALNGVSETEIANITISYEPVWAIGTGQAATPSQAEEVHEFLKHILEKEWGAGTQRVRILYGGSVTADNAKDLFRSPLIQGALVGKACLDPSSFAKIIDSAGMMPA